MCSVRLPRRVLQDQARKATTSKHLQHSPAIGPLIHTQTVHQTLLIFTFKPAKAHTDTCSQTQHHLQWKWTNANRSNIQVAANRFFKQSFRSQFLAMCFSRRLVPGKPHPFSKRSAHLLPTLSHHKKTRKHEIIQYSLLKHP